MSEQLIQSAKDNMEKTIENYSRDISFIKTGRANPRVLDLVKVNYYGFMTPLIEIAQVSVPEPRQMLIKPYERESLGPIEKAILAANIGFTPVNDGQAIRLNVPPLTGERRKELVRLLGKTSEEAKVAIRNIRRRVNDAIKQDKTVSEDITRKEVDELQKVTNEFIKRIEELQKAKEKEITTV